jgi:hypothetical protein
MKLWPEVRDGNWLEDILGDPKATRCWIKIFNSTAQEANQSWAYRWTFSCWIQNYLSIISNTNLISNIGFGEQSTHTKSANSLFFNMQTEPMKFPLQHPPFVIRDSLADDFTHKTLYSSSFINRAKKKLEKIIIALLSL